MRAETELRNVNIRHELASNSLIEVGYLGIRSIHQPKLRPLPLRVEDSNGSSGVGVTGCIKEDRRKGLM